MGADHICDLLCKSGGIGDFTALDHKTFESVMIVVVMIMIVVVIIIMVAVVVMLVASKSIYQFVNRHPSVKMLALAFLLLIGMTLIAEGLGEKIPKGYVYAAMAFSVFVEVLNIGSKRRRAAANPVHLAEKMSPDPDSEYATS